MGIPAKVPVILLFHILRSLSGLSPAEHASLSWTYNSPLSHKQEDNKHRIMMVNLTTVNYYDNIIVDDRSTMILTLFRREITMEKKEQIIEIAADLIHQYGFNNLGIQRIIKEANIPKGSFYYFFKSKEDLGLNVIEHYIQETKKVFNLFDKSIDGLKAFFNCFFKRFEELDYKRGCPIGNLVLELADTNEKFRLKLLEWSTFLEDEIIEILKDVNLISNIDKKTLASFIISSFEGALLKAKLEKTCKPLEGFDYYVFELLLEQKEEK